MTAATDHILTLLQELCDEHNLTYSYDGVEHKVRVSPKQWNYIQNKSELCIFSFELFDKECLVYVSNVGKYVPYHLFEHYVITLIDLHY